MRNALRNRARAQSITTVPPTPESANYSAELAKAASIILYQSPIRSKAGLPIYILNAAALPDVKEVEYNSLLPYVIARLPGEDELVSGAEYEVIFFAGSGAEGSASSKRSRPGWGWLVQAYHLLSRAMRKRIQRLYIVHERTWVRVITEMFSSIVSPKFRRKIVHGSSCIWPLNKYEAS
jgi:Rho GTPase-activating protein 1